MSPTDGPSLPDPKARTLARGPRRYRRHVASRVEWGELRAAKDGPCRICAMPPPNELHHLVGRDRGGDDVAANLVPLDTACHDLVERRNGLALAALFSATTDEERAYCRTKLGPNALERIFGEAVLA